MVNEAVSPTLAKSVGGCQAPSSTRVKGNVVVSALRSGWGSTRGDAAANHHDSVGSRGPLFSLFKPELKSLPMHLTWSRSQGDALLASTEETWEFNHPVKWEWRRSSPDSLVALNLHEASSDKPPSPNMTQGEGAYTKSGVRAWSLCWDAAAALQLQNDSRVHDGKRQQTRWAAHEHGAEESGKEKEKVAIRRNMAWSAAGCWNLRGARRYGRAPASSAPGEARLPGGSTAVEAMKWQWHSRTSTGAPCFEGDGEGERGQMRVMTQRSWQGASAGTSVNPRSGGEIWAVRYDDYDGQQRPAPPAPAPAPALSTQPGGARDAMFRDRGAQRSLLAQISASRQVGNAKAGAVARCAVSGRARGRILNALMGPLPHRRRRCRDEQSAIPPMGTVRIGLSVVSFFSPFSPAARRGRYLVVRSWRSLGRILRCDGGRERWRWDRTAANGKPPGGHHTYRPPVDVKDDDPSMARATGQRLPLHTPMSKALDLGRAAAARCSCPDAVLADRGMTWGRRDMEPCSRGQQQGGLYGSLCVDGCLYLSVPFVSRRVLQHCVWKSSYTIRDVTDALFAADLMRSDGRPRPVTTSFRSRRPLDSWSSRLNRPFVGFVLHPPYRAGHGAARRIVPRKAAVMRFGSTPSGSFPTSADILHFSPARTMEPWRLGPCRPPHLAAFPMAVHSAAPVPGRCRLSPPPPPASSSGLLASFWVFCSPAHPVNQFSPARPYRPRHQRLSTLPPTPAATAEASSCPDPTPPAIYLNFNGPRTSLRIHMIMVEQQYLAPGLPHSDGLAGASNLPDGARSAATAPPTSAYPDFAPYGAEQVSSSYNLSSQCDSNLLTPISAAGSPPLHHLRKPVRHYPPPPSPAAQQPTPPGSSKMYHHSWGQFDMNGQTSQASSPMAPHAPVAPDYMEGNPYQVGREREPPIPPVPYMGVFRVSDGAESQQMPQPYYPLNPADQHNPMLVGNHPSMPMDLQPRGMPGPPLLNEPHPSHYRQQHRHSSADESALHGMPDRPRSINGSPRRRMVQTNGRVKKRAAKSRAGSSRANVPEDPLDEHKNCLGDEVPPALKSSCPAEELCIFESRWKHRHQKGQDMWESIQNDFNERFHKCPGKEMLQMKFKRGRSKYYDWLDKDVQILGEAWAKVEDERYQLILAKFLELGGSRNMRLSASDVEVKVVNDLRLEEGLYMESHGNASIRRRRKTSSTKKRSSGRSMEDTDMPLSDELMSVSSHNTQDDEVINQVHSRRHPNWDEVSSGGNDMMDMNMWDQSIKIIPGVVPPQRQERVAQQACEQMLRVNPGTQQAFGRRRGS
ncbi:hypothetical protein G7046_g6239 [Stylonectria norvegica]|nr:hypothetical protein G7046_g6239 [Stylonectria norvegica]